MRVRGCGPAAICAAALIAVALPAHAAEQLPQAPPPPPTPPATGNSVIFVKHAHENAARSGPLEPSTDPLAFYRNSIGFPAPGFQNLGGNLFRWDPGGVVTNLTKRNDAAVRNPDVSFDATRVLFSMKIGLAAKWQIYEMSVDGTDERRVSVDPTHSDLDPAYLPDGRIVFTSDRQRFIDPYTEWPSAQLHVMDADGNGVVQLSSNPGGDFCPTTTASGHVSFSRWDVKLSGVWPPNPIDVSRFQLWKMTPDGENDAHPSFGAHSLPDFAGGYLHAREMPDGSGRFVATVTNDPFLHGAGALAYLSTGGDQDLHRPAYITDERSFTTSDRRTLWRDPYPTSQGDILASRAETVPVEFTGGITAAPPPNFAIVRINSDGTGAQVLFDDPEFSEWEPVEVAPRAVPPILETTRDTTVDWGILNTLDVALRGLNQDVAAPDFQGALPDEPGLKIRVYEASRVRRDRAGIFDDYRLATPTLLGDVPVRADGSFAARLRADVPIAWEVRDAAGRLLVKDRFWNQVLPGQTQTCNGCHSPHSGRQGRTSNIALAAPSDLIGLDPRVQTANTAISASADVLTDAARLLDALREGGAKLRGLERRSARAGRLLSRAERRLERGRPKKATRLAELAGRRALALHRRAVRLRD